MSNKVFVTVGVDRRNIPEGGDAGQFLVKASDEDYDYVWADVSGTGAERQPSTGVSPRDGTDTNGTAHPNGVRGSSVNYARQDHSHPRNVPTSGLPKKNGTAAIGNSDYYAAFNHVHPVDDSRAAQSEFYALQTTVSNLSAMFSGFTVTLTTTWTNNEQTVSDAKFIASGYAYLIAPASSSLEEYGDCGIYADDVDTDGEITFHCTAVPSSPLTVNVLRTKA